MRASFALTAVLVACLTTGIPGAEAPGFRSQATLQFERVVSPFVVEDTTGRAFAVPFVGGLDVPRPQFVDIDADGDRDLFIQEYSSQLWFFENVGSASAPKYEWRSDRYMGIDIGEWYRLVDVDGDGRVDLICEKPFSFIHFYRNVGTPAAAKFEYIDVLRDIDGAPVFMDRQNIPWLVDIDCDKRLDLFVGRVEGTLARFEASAPGATTFEFITENFEGIEIIGRVGDDGRPTMRHGANAIAFGDFEGDGDQDLFWGDFFEPSVLLIENIGRTCSSPSFDVEPVPLPYATSLATSGYNSPVPTDIDGDGDLDFLMGVLGGAFNPVGTSANNFFFWERTAADAFTLRSQRYLDMLDLGSETVPAFGDLDGDGDLDMLVGNKLDSVAGDMGRLTTFMNVGTAATPRFRQGASVPMAGAYHLAPALGDLDGDDDLDMILGTWNQDALYFRNDGSKAEPRWVQDESKTIVPERASNLMPTLADIDGDRDLDLFLGATNGVVMFYRNTGSRTAPAFTLVTDRLENVKAGRRSAPALVDLDGDGLLDLVVGQEASPALVYRHTGTKTAPAFTAWPEASIPLPHMATPRLVDLTGDGRLDIVTGTISGGLMFFKGR